MFQPFLQTAKRHKGLLLTAGMVLTLGWAAVSGTQSFDDLLQKQEQIRELQEQNALIESQNGELKEKIDRLESSPSDQDLEIRKLNMLKQGETIFMLPDAEKHKAAEPKPKQKKSKR